MSSPKLPGDGGGRSAGDPRVGSRSVSGQDVGAVGDAAASADPEVAAIQAEISDHLTTAAERLEQQGATPDESRQAAAASFGDVGEVGRRVYWIRRGDALLWRGAIALLVAGLAVSLVVVSIRSWQAESRMAGEIGALTEQLQKLAERQAQTSVVPAPPATPAPLEITGTAYIGAPDRPAASVPIELIDVQTGKTVRQFTSDAAGKFNTGPLAGGDYALVAEVLQDAPKSEQPLMLQSAPINAYPGVAIPPQTLDLSFPYGRLAIELSRPLPTFEVAGEVNPDGSGKPTPYESRLLIKVRTPQLLAGRWITEQSAPPAWPVFLSSGARSEAIELPRIDVGGASGTPSNLWTFESPPQHGLWFFEILAESDLSGQLAGSLFREDEGLLPAGECQIVASLLVHDVLPAKSTKVATADLTSRGSRGGMSPETAARFEVFRRQAILNSISRFGPMALRRQATEETTSDHEQWLTHLWYDLKNQLSPENRPRSKWQSAISNELESFEPSELTVVPIKHDSLTTIRIEIPDDLESRIRLINDASQPEAAKAAWGAGYPFLRPAKITVVGTAPLPPAEK